MATEQSKIPPAKSLIQGLRCIGYNFSTALADIIDNSINKKYTIINAKYKKYYPVTYKNIFLYIFIVYCLKK